MTSLTNTSRQYIYTSERDWTNAVKSIFGAIGKAKGYETYFSTDGGSRNHSANGIQLHIKEQLNLDTSNYSYEYQYGQYKYDILWMNTNKECLLVAESEFGSYGAVEDDFEKLLYARCKYKFMIFQGTQRGIRNIIQTLINKIKNLTQQYPQERYLFCPYSRDQFQIDQATLFVLQDKSES